VVADVCDSTSQHNEKNTEDGHWGQQDLGCVTYSRIFYWMIGFIDTLYIELQVIPRYRYSTHFPVYRYIRIRVLSHHKSLLGNSSQQWLFLCKVSTRCYLVTNLSNGDFSASVDCWLTLQNCTQLYCTRSLTELGRLSRITSEWTHREHRLRHRFCCWLTSLRTFILNRSTATAVRVTYRDNSSTVLCRHYLATAISLPPQFLHWANTPYQFH
jgi:hypothetical protein